MNIHSNATTTPVGRARIARRINVDHESAATVAADLGISQTTVRKWAAVGQANTNADTHCPKAARTIFADRSSAPHRRRCWPAETHAEAIRLRVKERLSGREVAARIGVPRSTVAAWFKDAGIGRIKDIDPKPPVKRYEHEAAGDMLHLDTKKLGRFRQPGHRTTGNRRQASPGAGYEYAHVCIDDATRIAYVEVLPDERGHTAAAFLKRAATFYAERGVTHIQRVLTDNGSCYRSHLFADAIKDIGAKHCRTMPYRPQTNGKAERFIQTMLREWAYATEYPNSQQRTHALPPWLRWYNEQRRHGTIKMTPAQRLQRERQPDAA